LACLHGVFYLFGVPIGYIAMTVLGWPWINVLRRWHRLSADYVCLGAGIIGAVAFGGFITLIGTHPNAAAAFNRVGDYTSLTYIRHWRIVHL
jgi:hypothetical protein